MINWHWTKEEDQKLRQLFPVMPTENVAARLGRSLSAVRNRAYQLGIRKSSQGRHNADGSDPKSLNTPWTEKEDEILRRMYPEVRAGSMPLQRTIGAIRRRASELGIHKSKKFIAASYRSFLHGKCI